MYTNKVSKKRVNRTEDGNRAGNESTENQPPKKRRHIVSIELVMFH